MTVPDDEVFDEERSPLPAMMRVTPPEKLEVLYDAVAKLAWQQDMATPSREASATEKAGEPAELTLQRVQS
jgi:hypothetical protein